MTKRYLKLLLILVLFMSLFTVSGCKKQINKEYQDYYIRVELRMHEFIFFVLVENVVYDDTENNILEDVTTIEGLVYQHIWLETFNSRYEKATDKNVPIKHLKKMYYFVKVSDLNVKLEHVGSVEIFSSDLFN